LRSVITVYFTAEERLVLGAHTHGVDHDLRPVVTGDCDDLEQVRGAIRAEVEHLAVVLLADRESVFDGVQDVLILDPVSPNAARTNTSRSASVGASSEPAAARSTIGSLRDAVSQSTSQSRSPS
jgi:hypothetical protein